MWSTDEFIYTAGSYQRDRGVPKLVLDEMEMEMNEMD